MTTLLTLIALIIALIGLLKKHVPHLETGKSTAAIACLLVLTAFITIAREYQTGKRTIRQAWYGILHSPTKSKEQYPVLMLGPTALRYTGKADQPMFQIADEPIFLKMINGEAAISVILRDNTGKIMGGIRDNEWFLYQGPISDRNFNDNTLEAKDDKGGVVLQVRVQGERILLAGTFFSKAGVSVIFGPGLNKFQGREKRPLEPYFRYPNRDGQHAGELESH